MKQTRSFVGMDVHKATISISVAEDGRSGPVRFLGVIPNTPEAVHKMAKRLARHGELDFCYEASGCGYGIHRQLTATWAQVHRGRAVDDPAQARRADQDRPARFGEAGHSAPLRGPDAGLGSRHDARSASRSGQSTSGCIDAPDACAPAVARLPASSWPQLSDRQALDTAPSQLACRADVPGACPWHRLPGLPGDGVDCTAEKRCPDREDLCDGCEAGRSDRLSKRCADCAAST